ncbi:MAG: YkgJ family cysteine cluster protein [Proteobacteria bacterium]|nr:YkgJ family cysteine cluster protein [Pseudomonadota bacterium]
MSTRESPCTSCGACCARFQVTFYSPQNVPEEARIRISDHEYQLKSKRDAQGRPRCLSLRGEIGCSVSCGIYELRPSPCREFRHSFEGGGPREPRCDAARAAIGLPPIEPGSSNQSTENHGVERRLPQPRNP